MHFLSQIIGALIEAWGEVKVQKARVILSLVGVVAAVAAMTTVIALGELASQSFAEIQEAFSGRAITLTINVNQKSEGDGAQNPSPGHGGVVENFDGTFTELGLPFEEQPQAPAGRGEDMNGKPLDPVGDAMTTVADRFKIPYWSLVLRDRIDFRELHEAYNSGVFRGSTVKFSEWGVEPPELAAVDPDYQVLFRLKMLQGRWIQEDDWQQRVAPVVINGVMWEQLGQPDINVPLVLHANDDSGRMFRVVGVVKTKAAFDPPQAFVSYKAWKYMSVAAAGSSQAQPQMMVWVGNDQVEDARRLLPRAVASVLGANWEGSVGGGETQGIAEDQSAVFTTVIMIIGSIVIFLGALGLLNVAIVTVRQRIREIGIRRAMGASAGRVFFAVFMESVVATFLAGVLGVALAIVVVRFLPLEYLGVFLQDRPAFPMGAALIGVAISTSIGALCGIIPAVAAVKVKPIDAIRY